MPFRYVKGEDGLPKMPKVNSKDIHSRMNCVLTLCQGMRELIAKDADKAIDDLF